MSTNSYRTQSYKFKLVYLPIIIFIIVFILLTCFVYCKDINAIKETISKDFYISIFTGFFTLGALLLTLKFYLISALQTNIYDTKEYQDLVYNKFKNNVNLYAPLQRVIEVLLVTMVVALVTAIFNLFAIIIQKNFYIIIVISMTVVAFYYLVLSVYVYSVAMCDLQQTYFKKNDTFLTKYKNSSSNKNI